jgi:pimeloyl-ACP methyl ester carboxylesterase
MNNVTEYFKQAEPAFATYANLEPEVPSTDELKNDTVGMSPTQAARFAARWRVVAQYNDPQSGLSATVFSEVGGSGQYLAIRGTEFSDFLRDVIVSDGIIFVGYLPELMPQYNAFKRQVASWLADGTLSGSFTVSGHSLGGYLASALMAEYPANAAQAYLYNAPGLNGVLGGVTAAILDAFGIAAPLDPARIVNVKAQAGTSLIAGLGAQVSPPIPIAIENQVNNPDRPASYNHSQRVLTDALAIYALYSEFAPSLSVEQIGHIVRASSNSAAGTLEGVLDALRATLGIASPTEVEDREALYANLYALQQSAVYRNLKGAAAVRILAGESAASIVAKAESDFGYFFALYHGLPMAIAGGARQWRCAGVHRRLAHRPGGLRGLAPEDRPPGPGAARSEHHCRCRELADAGLGPGARGQHRAQRVVALSADHAPAPAHLRQGNRRRRAARPQRRSIRRPPLRHGWR